MIGYFAVEFPFDDSSGGRVLGSPIVQILRHKHPQTRISLVVLPTHFTKKKKANANHHN